MTDTKKTDDAGQQAGKTDQKVSSDTVTESSDDTEAEEYGGPKGLEPTRYGDWERKGILSDF